ncbi:hypothetical protein GCM10009085_32460 [Pseudomonas avellanae]|nr:hypothetical protein GCM10009085_32460 [Pseudomonas avellanae]
MHRPQPKVLNQRFDVIAHGFNAIALVRLVGAAMTAHVHDHDAVVAGQHRNLVLPVLTAGTQAVQQQNRLALAILFVVQ